LGWVHCARTIADEASVTGRVSVTLSSETTDILENLAALHGYSKAEALRRAVTVFERIDNIQRDGGKVVLLTEDGTAHELWIA